MQANEFVKEHGWSLVQRDVAALEQGFITKADFLENYGFEILDELAQLVKSRELVEFFGCLDDAIQIYEFSKDTKTILYAGRVIKIDQLKQAIADMESCQ